MPDDPCPDCSAKDDEIAILESSLDEANATIADFKRDLAAADEKLDAACSALDSINDQVRDALRDL